ncbi:MAG: BppU family phage baseplate upper protein [Clostridia bacterium]|nr:BppU family phage baseplate upper protein [Clostridia bacterium]
MSDYTIDVRDAGGTLQTERFRVGDSGLRTLTFHLTDGKNAFSLPDDCIATLYARLPSGTTFFESLGISGDTLTYTPVGGESTPSVTSEAGQVHCEIRITTVKGKLITCPSFSFVVEDVLQDDGAVEAESSFSALTDALGRVLEAESGLDSKVDADWVRSYVDEAIVEGEW